MEPAFKAGLQQAVDAISTTLPESNTQDVRASIQAATWQQLGGMAGTGTTAAPSVQALPTGYPDTRQILTLMLHKLETGTPRPNTGTDPLSDALARLKEYGISISPDGKGAQSTQLSPMASIELHRGNSHRGYSYSPENQLQRDGRECRVNNEHTRDAPFKEERSRGEEGRTGRLETPTEQRTKEALDRAIARYQERYGESTAAFERPAPSLSPEKPGTLQQPPEISPPTLIPDRSARPPETILSPAIRETLNEPRNDTARLLQQILAHDPSPSRPVGPTATGGWVEGSQGPAINPSIAEARASVTDRLSQLRDALQTTIERTSPQPATMLDRPSAVSQASTQQGDFTRADPPTHSGCPQTELQGEGRSGSGALRIPTRSIEHGANAPSAGGALRPVGQGRDEGGSHQGEKASSLIDALSRAAQKLLSLQALRKIDHAAETAVITAAAAIALGVMGSDIVLKEILALSEQILRHLRGDRALGDTKERAFREIEAAVRELEETCADRGVETIGQPTGLVADIPGAVRDDRTGQPLEGIEIDGGTLGITHTNAQGEFIFKNVPMEEGFVVVANNETYSFFPSPAIGTVSPNTFLTILARRV